MWPRWEVKEHSLIKYLRECVWGLERVESRINMIRHSWSTPCFIPEEVEPEDEASPLHRHSFSPRSCLVPQNSEAEDAPSVCMRKYSSHRLSCIPSMDRDDEDDDDDDDDDVLLYIPSGRQGPNGESGARSSVTTPTSARESPSRSSTTSPPRRSTSPGRPTSISPSRNGTKLSTSPGRLALQRVRKTSMPVPIHIPEDRVALHQAPLFSPLSCSPVFGLAAKMKQV